MNFFTLYFFRRSEFCIFLFSFFFFVHIKRVHFTAVNGNSRLHQCQFILAWAQRDLILTNVLQIITMSIVEAPNVNQIPSEQFKSKQIPYSDQHNGISSKLFRHHLFWKKNGQVDLKTTIPFMKKQNKQNANIKWAQPAVQCTVKAYKFQSFEDFDWKTTVFCFGCSYELNSSPFRKRFCL